jgi:hypothetical protein
MVLLIVAATFSMVGICILGVDVVQPANASLATQTSRPVGMGADSGNCGRATVKQELMKLRTQKDRRGIVCTEPVALSKEAKDRKTQKFRAAMADGPNGTVEPPEFCTSTPDGQWKFQRKIACLYEHRQGRLWQLDGEVLVLVGTWQYVRSDMYSVSPTIRTEFAYQQQISVSAPTGEARAGLTLVGGFSCIGWCAYGPSQYPLQQVGDGSTLLGGSRTFSSTALTVGDLGTVDINIKWTWGKSGYTNSDNFSNSPSLRCDHRLPGNTAAGCVFAQHTPVLVFDESETAYSQQTRHIRDAQASGLPGAPGSNLPLRRETNPDKRRANFETTCPQAYTRPAGHQCDEYPFQSTKQGGATQPPGTGRTHDWCSIPQLPTGVSNMAGWSSCMITTSHNRQGGLHIQSFYNSERVIEDDPFYVKVEP